MYPFEKVSDFHKWNDTLAASVNRKYNGTCPKRKVAGNTWWKISDKLDRQMQHIPVQDSRWVAMNPVVNSPFLAKEFYMKAHWWRSMDELYHGILQTVAVPMVPWVSTYENKNTDYKTASKVQFVEGLLSARFDGYSGDVTMPRYGLSHLWRSSN